MPIICQPTLRIIGLNTTKGREDNQNLIRKPDNQKIKMFIKCQILVNATKIKQNNSLYCSDERWEEVAMCQSSENGKQELYVLTIKS